jgi:hypothetical protein
LHPRAGQRDHRVATTQPFDIKLPFRERGRL